MENYFYSKNKQAKTVLLDLFKRYYADIMTKEEADNYNLTYTEEDMCPICDGAIMGVFHMYEANGLYMWEKLGITTPKVSLSEFDQIKENYVNEEKNSETYYRTEFLKTKLLIYGFIKSNCFTSMPLEEIVKNKIAFDIDMDYDAIHDSVYVYNNYNEEAGVNAFNLLGIENQVIPQSRFCEMVSKERYELLQLEENNQKVKKLN